MSFRINMNPSVKTKAAGWMCFDFLKRERERERERERQREVEVLRYVGVALLNISVCILTFLTSM